MSTHCMVLLDGKCQPQAEAKIKVTDKGVLLGMGLFETMRIRQGKVIGIDKHWQRLVKSAVLLDITLPLDLKALHESIKCLTEKNAVMNAGLRLTITAGTGPRGLLATATSKGHYLLECFALPEKSLTPYRLCWSSIQANPSNPLASIKSLSYLTHVFVKREAVTRGFDDALQLTAAGFVSETSCANFFMIKKNVLFTPPLTDGPLPGIMRERIIAHCKQAGVACVEKQLSVNEVLAAEGAFVCNALMGITAIGAIEATCYPISHLMTSLIASMADDFQ
mgnify:CR=1 FL=1